MIKPNSINYIQPFKQNTRQQPIKEYDSQKEQKNFYLSELPHKALTNLIYERQALYLPQSNKAKQGSQYSAYFQDNRDHHMRIQSSENSSEISEDHLLSFIVKLINIFDPKIRQKLAQSFSQLPPLLNLRGSTQERSTKNRESDLEPEPSSLTSSQQFTMRQSELSAQKASKITFGQEGEINSIPFTFKFTTKRKHQKIDLSQCKMKVMRNILKAYSNNTDVSGVAAINLKQNIKNRATEQMFKIKELKESFISFQAYPQEVDNCISEDCFKSLKEDRFLRVTSLEAFPSNMSIDFRGNPSQSTIINQISGIKDNEYEISRPMQTFGNSPYQQKQVSIKTPDKQKGFSTANTSHYHPKLEAGHNFHQNISQNNEYYAMKQRNRIETEQRGQPGRQNYYARPESNCRKISLEKNTVVRFNSQDHPIRVMRSEKSINNQKITPQVSFRREGMQSGQNSNYLGRHRQILISPRSAPSSPMVTRSFQTFNHDRNTLQVGRPTNPQRSHDSISSTPDLFRETCKPVKPHSYYLGHISKQQSQYRIQPLKGHKKSKKPQFKVVQEQYYDSNNVVRSSSQKKISLVTNRSQLIKHKK